jgi:hypothetical protein
VASSQFHTKQQLTHEKEEANPQESLCLHPSAPHPGLVNGEGGEVVANQRHQGVEAGPQEDLEQRCGGVDDLDEFALEQLVAVECKIPVAQTEKKEREKVRR